MTTKTTLSPTPTLAEQVGELATLIFLENDARKNEHAATKPREIAVWAELWDELSAARGDAEYNLYIAMTTAKPPISEVKSGVFTAKITPGIKGGEFVRLYRGEEIID